MVLRFFSQECSFYTSLYFNKINIPGKKFLKPSSRRRLFCLLRGLLGLGGVKRERSGKKKTIKAQEQANSGLSFLLYSVSFLGGGDVGEFVDGGLGFVGEGIIVFWTIFLDLICLFLCFTV